MNTTVDMFGYCPIKDNPSQALFHFIINGVLMNVIAFFGIIGNIISMIILSRPQMKSSINYLLIGLARFDTCLIITSVLLFGVPGIYPYTGYLFNYFYYVLPLMTFAVYPLALTFQTISLYITLTVTFERYVAVCLPLRERYLCTYGRARVYMFVTVIFSTVYNLPRFWETTLKKKHHQAMNTTIYCALPSELRLEKLYVSIYVHWMYFIFMYFIPFVGLIILNTAIYRQVRKANAVRRQLSLHQRREIGLATMLLCIVLVFFICNIFPLIVNILELFYHYLPSQIVDVSNLLITINSSVNFIIYVIFGEKFKRMFFRLFCSRSLVPPGGRESPDGGTPNDSLMSIADRHSIRLNRQSTMITRNGVSVRLNGSSNGNDRRSVRIRPPSPGPCVYYPASRTIGKDVSTAPTETTVVASDWEPEPDKATTGF